AAALEQCHELLDGGERHTERHCDVSVLAAAHHRLDDAQTYVERHRPVPLDCLLWTSFPFLLRHLFSPRPSAVTDPRTTGAMRTSAHDTPYCWRAAQVLGDPRKLSSCSRARSARKSRTGYSGVTRVLLVVHGVFARRDTR